MKKMLKRLCTGFLALATVVTALPTTPVHAESKQYWTESAERVGIIEKVMNDGSIGSTFNEGYMKVEGETAYCIDINTDFKNGYKTRADASSCMSADQISDVALSLEYVKQYGEAHKELNYKQVYLLEQCVVWQRLSVHLVWQCDNVRASYDEIPKATQDEVFAGAKAFVKGKINQLRFMNGTTYELIGNSSEKWVLGYKSATSQFSNDFLRSVFPSADLTIISCFLIAVITGFLVILKVYRNRLSKELNKITNIQNTILSDDREISELSSPLKEVNDILIILSEMEKTVKESTKKQLKQAQLLENSIQSLTHDIQTPATVVSGNLELLEETNMDVNQKEYVKYAQDGISKISEYVEELKTLSKLEQPKTEYVHFNEKYVDNLILLANQIARLKNVTVSVIQKDWTDDLLIEPKDIQKAFQNIISNAVGFSEKSSQIKLKFINNKSEYIVSVIDNGKGFSKESLEKATQKFYSENKARSGSHYGLGLSIVEKIMNEHSGFLQIENLEVDNIIVGAKVSLIFKLK